MRLENYNLFFLFIDCLKVNFRQSITKNICSANSSPFEVDGVRIIWAVAGINRYYIFKGIPASAAPFESEILAIRCEIGKLQSLFFVYWLSESKLSPINLQKSSPKIIIGKYAPYRNVVKLRLGMIILQKKEYLCSANGLQT